MYERIKTLRKTLKMTQDEFSSHLGLSRNFIAQIEIGTKIPSARTVSDICREYNVNEDWLRNGSGGMFIQKSKDKQIADLLSDIQLSSDDSFKHRLISALARLDSNGWEQLEKLLDMIYQK